MAIAKAITELVNVARVTPDSHATPNFWRETQMKTLQARQVDLSLDHFAA